MATTNYSLPTITGDMTADVVRDLNALADAVDVAIKQAVGTVDLSEIENAINELREHVADNVRHITAKERESWNNSFNIASEALSELKAFKDALLNGITSNQFSDGLATLDAFTVTGGYYNQPLTRMEA